MALLLAQWTVDVTDVGRAAEFWSRALDYDVEDDDGNAHLLPRGDGSGRPTVWLQHVDERSSVKNATHPDLVPREGGVEAEVQRLLALGARRADVGQTGNEGFVVLADPDGNEFCVLHRHAHGRGQGGWSLDGVDTVLVDVDGTLVDSNYHHAIAWQRAFREHGADVTTALVHGYVGMGGDRLVPAVAGEAFDHEHGDDVRAAWRREFDTMIGDVRPIAGQRELLEALAATGRSVVLASSGPREHVEHYVDLIGARDLVQAWTTSDDVSETKPAPDLLDAARGRVDGTVAVAIGDSPWDCRAAAQVDITGLAVRTGGFTEEQLAGAGAAVVYPSLRDLAADVRNGGGEAARARRTG